MSWAETEGMVRLSHSVLSLQGFCCFVFLKSL